MQADADVPLEEVGATACLLLLGHRAQARAPNSGHPLFCCRCWNGGAGVHRMASDPSRRTVYVMRAKHRETFNLEPSPFSLSAANLEVPTNVSFVPFLCLGRREVLRGQGLYRIH